MNETGYYWHGGSRQQRPRTFGANASAAELADGGYYTEREDRTPPPGEFYDEINSQAINYPYVDVQYSWVEWSPDRKRDNIKASAKAQIRYPSQDELLEDETKRWVPEQDQGRYKTLVEALAQTADENLDAFDGDLFAYVVPDADYARNMVRQETHNLAWDSELRSAGNGGIFSDSERADVQARVTANAKVSRGTETGVRTPSVGAPREWVTMDGEDARDASFYEIQFDWSGQDYFIPRVVLDEIPEGVNAAQVFAMVYDAANVYRSWMPFVQGPDGKWSTPSDVNYLSIAKQASSTWRVAVAYGGTSSEYEITSRVSIVPPNSVWAHVRWGGRNGQPVAASSRRRR